MGRVPDGSNEPRFEEPLVSKINSCLKVWYALDRNFCTEQIKALPQNPSAPYVSIPMQWSRSLKTNRKKILSFLLCPLSYLLLKSLNIFFRYTQVPPLTSAPCAAKSLNIRPAGTCTCVPCIISFHTRRVRGAARRRLMNTMPKLNKSCCVKNVFVLIYYLLSRYILVHKVIPFLRNPY